MVEEDDRLWKEFSDVLKKAQAGDKAAQDQIGRRLHSMSGSMRSSLWRMGVAWDDTEDVWQDIVLRVMRNLHFDNPCRETFLAYLYKTEWSLVKRYRKKRQNAARETLDLCADITRPSDHATSIDVQKALDSLPAEMREAVELRDLYELTFQQIAQHFNVSISAIKARVYRAHQRMREALGHPH